MAASRLMGAIFLHVDGPCAASSDAAKCVLFWNQVKLAKHSFANFIRPDNTARNAKASNVNQNKEGIIHESV